MKKNTVYGILMISLFVLFVSCVTTTETLEESNPQTQQQALENKFAEVDQLISERKYFSAFNLLTEMEKENPSDVDIVIRKFYFIPEYFVQSTMHQIFLFKDLEPNEDIYELRSNLPEGSFEFVMYDPVSVHKDFTEKYGPSPELDLALGEFYLDAISRYGMQWLVTPDEVDIIVKKLFETADAAGFYNAFSLSKLGEYSSNDGDYLVAEDFFRRSLDLDLSNAIIHYNLARVILFNGVDDEFFEHINYAIEHYEERNYRADAFYLAAEGAMQISELQLAEEYLAEGYNNYPDYYLFAQNLNNLYLYQERFEEAASYADILFALGPENPNATRIVMDNYINSDYMDELVLFFLRNLELYTGQTEAEGNLYFHLSIIYSDMDEVEKSLAALDSAEDKFQSVMDPDDQVFEVIENLREGLKNR